MELMSFALKVYVLHLMIQIVASAPEINEYYPNERDALMQIRDIVKSSSNLHGNWTGPPCYLNSSNWAGIACSNSHVVRLVLEGIQLTASLPPAFLQNITFLTKLSFRNNSIFGPLPNLTNLLHLEFVLLSHNHFSGSIPLEYITLPRLAILELQDNSLNGPIPPFNQSTLTVFNVSYNHLEGLIPETDVLQSFPKSSYDHNSDLCGAPLGIPCPVSPPPPPPTPPPPTPPPPPPFPVPSNPSKDKKKKNLQVWSIVLISAAAALVPLLVMLVFLCYYRRVHGKEEKADEPTGEGYLDGAKKRTQWSESTEDPERTVELEFFNRNRLVFDLDDLLRASAEVLGKGKLGTTYKAMLDSNSVVAVKRPKEMNALSKKEFVQQMQLLGKMRHENLVEIISFYYSNNEKLIVYEFVPHGSLFELLHENRGVGRVPLNWSARLSIIKDIANGLSFLHQSLPYQRVPHANLKSSNVLIQRIGLDYHSMLTDFGFLPLLQSQKSSQKLAIGKSPEFSQGKKLTYKADVYCFGIIILEVITGKNPGEYSPGNHSTVDDLSDWVRTVLNTDWSTEILDVEILAAKEGQDDMLKLTEIALECTDLAPEKRPKMNEVLRRIEEIELANTENERVHRIFGPHFTI